MKLKQKKLIIPKKAPVLYNNKIQSTFVKVINDDRKISCAIALDKAITIAKARNLDLVQVAQNGNIPICKMLDYGKYRYNVLKKSKQSKTKKVKTKEIKLRTNTDIHDLNIKLKLTRTIIEKGHRAKVNLVFRGRESMYESAGRETLDNFARLALSFAKLENEIKKEGRNISLLLIPKNG